MELGRLIRESRQSKGYTQQAIADILKISRSYYSDVENGRYYPSGKLIFKLNKELDLFYLIENDGKTDR